MQYYIFQKKYLVKSSSPMQSYFGVPTLKVESTAFYRHFRGRVYFFPQRDICYSAADVCEKVVTIGVVRILNRTPRVGGTYVGMGGGVGESVLSIAYSYCRYMSHYVWTQFNLPSTLQRLSQASVIVVSL